ncbi:unnamed protein product [Adineta steineri]|uniref:Peptidyl-prolyl cis-trans isomerase n=1 Tax=Adineta steineri TaxID=433720 RepID=A0A819WBG9_9BILA|nr:unnamed protein product [Adineta steineri]CAF4120490.1 unnamed protein product [Adineta steineri]
MFILCKLLLIVIFTTVFSCLSGTYPPSYCIRLDTDVKNASGSSIIINITQNWAPIGANHLFDIINSQFYAVPSAFFRVVPKFVVQFGISGDPIQNTIWNKTILDDPVLMSNIVGTVSYATDGPNTRTTQLFINYRNNSRLDLHGFAPIGVVTTGLDVANTIFNPTPDGPSSTNDRRRSVNGNGYRNNAYFSPSRFPAMAKAHVNMQRTQLKGVSRGVRWQTSTSAGSNSWCSCWCKACTVV